MLPSNPLRYGTNAKPSQNYRQPSSYLKHATHASQLGLERAAQRCNAGGGGRDIHGRGGDQGGDPGGPGAAGATGLAGGSCGTCGSLTWRGGRRERGSGSSHAPEVDPMCPFGFGRPQATMATLMRGLQPLMVSPALLPPACVYLVSVSVCVPVSAHAVSLCAHALVLHALPAPLPEPAPAPVRPRPVHCPLELYFNYLPACCLAVCLPLHE